MSDVIMTAQSGEEITAAIADSPALLGYETSRARPPSQHSIEFCDWPFTDPDATVDDHVEAVGRECPEYAVAPDVEGEWTLRDVIGVADELAQYAETVIVVPKECEPDRVPERFCIGYPNQPNWGSNGAWYQSAYPNDRPVHVLGGSPDSQLALTDYLTVGSVDGANVAAYAEYGRIWTPGSQLERPDLSYYERIRESLGNLHAVWNRGGRDRTPRDEVDAAQATLGGQQNG